MFERGIRGGITHSVNRWAEANNPYMGPEFVPDKPTRYLQYLDANNLYGWANVSTFTYWRVQMG